MGQTQRLSEHTSKANQRKPNGALGLASNCAEKPHQHSTSTRLRKQALCRPVKVHTTERLATQPLSASPLPTCSHLKQSARAPQKPTTAPPAPQTLANRKPAQTPLDLKPPRPQEAAPPFFTANRAPCTAKPLGQTAQLPQRGRHGCGKGGDHLTAPQPQPSPRPIFKVLRCSGRDAAQLTCNGSASHFHHPKSIRPRHFCFFFSPSARFLLSPLPNDCLPRFPSA